MKTLITKIIPILWILLSTPLWAQKEQPNVIVILVDDQGYGDIASNGNPWIQTPEMDKLHDNGVRFSDFHVDPTCAPTRAALMTGRYSARTGVWLTFASRDHLRRDEITMADVFKQNGYKTAMFGKWHLGDEYPYNPNNRGFDESLTFGGGVIGETSDHWGNNYYNDIYLRNGKEEKVEGYCTDIWFNEAIQFINKNKENPFFIYLPTNTAHVPHHVPEKYRKPYKQRAAFYGTLASIDENIGKLRTYLKELSIEKETLIVFLTDNGTGGGVSLTKVGHDGRDGWPTSGYNAGMRGKKSSHYEGGHRAACFMYWPNGNITGGKEINGVTAHIDLLPTIIDLCNLKYKHKNRLDGISLKPVINNSKEKLIERSVVVHDQGRFTQGVGEGKLIKYKEYAVMNGTWRLIGNHWPEELGNELYDLSKDPAQRNDISKQHPDLVKKLQQDYENWWTKISQKSDEYCPFIINPSKNREVKITSQGIMGGKVAYNQRHVFNAMPVDGFAIIDVEVPGNYKVTLSRWPKELNAPIGALVPKRKLDPTLHTIGPNSKLSCIAIPATQARLKVGGFDKTVPVTTADKQIVFNVKFKKGEQKIQTWFILDNGDTNAAYYTYITPM